MKSLYTIFLTALILIACSADKSAPENNKYKGTWEFTLPDSDDKGALRVRDRLLLDEDKWVLDRTVNATLANEYFEVHVTFRGFIGTKSKITHDDGSVSVELELERARIDDYKYHFPSLEPRISIVASLDRLIIETGLNSNDPDFIFRATLHSPESDSGQLIDLKPDTGYLEYLHTDYSSGEYQLIHMNLPNAPLYKLSQDTNDRDGDGVPNEQDAFPDDFWFQSDLDGDGIGDYDDPDIDGDGRLNKEDAFPSDPNEVNDFDRDGIGDNADTDFDGDGIPNTIDALPLHAGFSSPKQLVSGHHHSCLLDQGYVRCWGGGDWQKLIPPQIINPISIAAGHYFSCAIEGETVRCWGTDITDWRTHLPLPDQLTSPSKISAATSHACILEENRIVCWGNNNSNKATPPENLVQPTDLSLGKEHSCVIDEGEVVCWGDLNSYHLQAPKFDNPVSQLSAGNHHTCAISGGELVCWGFNAYGQTNVPANLPPVEIVKAGANHTCAVAEQRVYCWGLIGDKEIYQQLDEVVELSSGDGFSCAISGNGVYCWGENHSGQLEIPGSDIDMDGVYDRYDPDRDGDGVYNSDDEFPDDPDETHDLDGDKIGDNKDPDRDGDGVANNLDLFPDDADEFFDIDGDGQGDNQDIDRDGDGVFNHFDPDRDGDGVLNEADFAPDDALNVSDLDGDGIGDSFDSDWDGDGLENSNDPDPTSTQLYKPSKVVVGGSAAKNNAFGCAIDGTGVSCWGRQRSKIIPNESIAAPSDIAVVDSTKICVIDTNRIICWGDYPRNDFYEKVPRPKRFVSNQDQVCVHTDEGLYCPRNKQTPLTDSKFIEPFYNREDIFCGWKKAELVCRGYSYLSERFDEFTLPEELINPTILSLSKQGLSCAIDRSQLKCWDRYWNGYNEVEVIHGPKLLHPIDMQLYNNDVCAADDYGIRCWERIYETPHPYNGFKLAENFNIRLSKVTSYDLTSNYGCAISAGEIHCWGELVSPGKDTDGDGIEDVNDKDLDGDGIENRRDAFRFDPLEWSDLDQDGIGDNSDTDLDGDQLNNENDPDIDNDGIANEEDLAPYSKAPAKIRFIQADNDFTSCEIGEQIVRCSEDNYFPIHIKHKPHFSVNDYRYCAIVDKVVQCWDTDYTQTIPLPNNLSFSDPKAITLGQGHTCVIDGINIVCWGNNRFGQLEIPSGIDEPLLIAAGSKHTCATAESGVVCWGNNEHGQLDAPANLNKVTLLSSAKDYNCAVANNELSCWGSIDWEVPKQLENPVVLSLSDDYFCALDDLGVRCWGKSFWKTKLNAPKTLFNPVDVSVK